MDDERRAWHRKMVARQVVKIAGRPPFQTEWQRARQDTGPWLFVALAALTAFSVGFLFRWYRAEWVWRDVRDDLDQFVWYGVAGGVAAYIVTFVVNLACAPFRQRNEARREFMALKRDHVNDVIDRLMEPFAYPLKYRDGTPLDEVPLAIFLMLRLALDEYHGVGWQTIAAHLRDGRWNMPLNHPLKYRLMLTRLANLGVIDRAGPMEYFSDEGVGVRSMDTKYVMSPLGHSVLQRLANDDVLPPFKIDIEEEPTLPSQPTFSGGAPPL